MANGKSYELFEEFIAQTGNTYVFSGESAVKGVPVLLQVIRDMGLDPMKTRDLRKGVLSLFHVELINTPELGKHRFLLAPNHVSDMDALILGLLHPHIRIVSKDDWTGNERLRQFLDLHYDLYGLDRASVSSLRALIRDAVDYFADRDENRHYLVFSQGTISDFNHNSLERISPIAQRICERTDVPIVVLFMEQASLHHPTRIVFDEPIRLSRKDDFRKIWLERQTALQSSLVSPARRPNLSHKHSNNNRPGDPFF